MQNEYTHLEYCASRCRETQSTVTTLNVEEAMWAGACPGATTPSGVTMPRLLLNSGLCMRLHYIRASAIRCDRSPYAVV